MQNIIRYILLAFAAGAAGGLANALAVWGSGSVGLTHAFGVDIAPALTKAMIYTRVTWGGVWGAALLLPFVIRGWPLRAWWLNGIALSLLPSANTLFYLMPAGPAGMMGLEKGLLTPLFVLAFNAVWGLCAMLCLHLAGVRR